MIILFRTFQLAIFIVLFSFAPLKAQNHIINGPNGSGQFGKTVTVLPNGNYVVTDPLFDNALTDVGAVYLYNGATHALISKMIGSVANDQVGSGGVSVLSNGNYVVRSPNWDNNLIVDAGAVTWCNANIGRAGALNSTNSLVGSSANDQVGSPFIYPLPNGNYVVFSCAWNNGSIVDAGAVTWCDGAIGRTGAISSSNSLVGSSDNDSIGAFSPINPIVQLNNGNYVILSRFWDNGPSVATDAGAVTWCDAALGRTGAISSSNSLVGSNSFDQIGFFGIQPLTNGNYVVMSRAWDRGGIVDAGAATWCSGTTGRTGFISNINSLVGSSNSDNVGINVLALTNGNYVVQSPNWSNGVISRAGAATWCDGTTGRVGTISSSNSLIGSDTNDRIASRSVALSNGNYVVGSENWTNGSILNAGAVTWCNGSIGRFGLVNSSNSLVGTKTNDRVPNALVALTNGNYVVVSKDWDNGAITDAGAVTWCDGNTGLVGTISTSNSLTGSTANDQIGLSGIVSLPNGNYIVKSSTWDNGAISNAGAVTWGNGLTGITGSLSASNSLVGSSTSDFIGNNNITILQNGNYIVTNPLWDNGLATNAGAATWCNGSTGRVGSINATNSLIGSTTEDRVGLVPVIKMANSNYIVISRLWDNGPILDAGAVTWCNGTTGRVGTINSTNSLVGLSDDDQVGDAGYLPLSNGHYIIESQKWDKGTTINAGAITIAKDNNEIVGPINSCNSVIGSVTSNVSNPLNAEFNETYNYLVVGLPAENKIVIRRFSTDSTLSRTICANQSFLWNGIARNTSGAFKDTFSSFSGCDSVVTLNLTVTALPSKLTNTTGNTITAAQAGATYQWINCATNTSITGANAQSFTPSFNGSFKVVVTQTNCSDTSTCVPINTVGLNQNNLRPHVQIYPNPARESLTVSLSASDVNANMVLLSLDGKKLQTYPLTQKINMLPISTLSPGFYLYEISFNGHIEKGKLLIEE